jgi:hypothetical protein
VCKCNLLDLFPGTRVVKKINEGDPDLSVSSMIGFVGCERGF